MLEVDLVISVVQEAWRNGLHTNPIGENDIANKLFALEHALENLLLGTIM